MRELTLENLISFLNTDTSRQEKVITENSDIAYNFGSGLDIDDLLISLEDEFEVSFEYFEFDRYFYPEGFEYSLKGCVMMMVNGVLLPFNIVIAILRWVFNVPEQYKPDLNKELCTPVTLYEYMIKNKKRV
ncbi:DUF1493 family protein [Myroides odoratimimus]|uniref:DUF1493 family protein n=1 Tax=Myroides odoratimimus TaxID=76832 RepID=UPI002DBF1718|nr:DUF1493 family protein [Myroides odoratimimus]MEC4051586.1 DUF1493 family protein [Myroides odoratimimus]